MHRLVMVCGALLALTASAMALAAEEVEFFRASTAGEEAWAASGARIRKKLGKLVVSERNKKGSEGALLLADNLPLFTKGVIRLDVNQVPAGVYTLQLLTMKQGGHAGTINLVTESKDKGASEFWVEDLGISPQVTEFLLKFWVAGAEGASTKLNDITYSVELDESSFLLDERLADTTLWKLDKMLLQAGEEGASLSLEPGQRGGSILYKTRFPRTDFGGLLLDLPVLENGYVTVQVIAFDHRDAYLGSMDLVKNVGAGMHAAGAQEVAWPEGSEKFMIKLWLSGELNTRATLARLLITRPTETVVTLE